VRWSGSTAAHPAAQRSRPRSGGCREPVQLGDAVMRPQRRGPAAIANLHMIGRTLFEPGAKATLSESASRPDAVVNQYLAGGDRGRQVSQVCHAPTIGRVGDDRSAGFFAHEVLLLCFHWRRGAETGRPPSRRHSRSRRCCWRSSHCPNAHCRAASVCNRQLYGSRTGGSVASAGAASDSVSNIAPAWPITADAAIAGRAARHR